MFLCSCNSHASVTNTSAAQSSDRGFGCRKAPCGWHQQVTALLMGTSHLLLTSCCLQSTNHEADYVRGAQEDVGRCGGSELQLCLSPGSSEMASVREKSITECKELKEEEVLQLQPLDCVTSGSPQSCFVSWAVVSSRMLGSLLERGSSSSRSQTPTHLQGSSFESPSATPGVCHYDPERVTLANLWA